MPGLLDHNKRPILVNKHLLKTLYCLGSIVCHKGLGSGSRTRNKQPVDSIPADCVSLESFNWYRALLYIYKK